MEGLRAGRTGLGLAAFAVVLFMVGVVIQVTAPTANLNAGTGSTVALDQEEQAFLQIINDYRSSRGLGPLTPTLTLTAANDWHGYDMGTNRYFSHTDSLSRSPWQRYCDFGYCYNTWKGENIAAGYRTAQSVFEGWRDSPGHNANMLGANFTVIGIARVEVSGSPYGVYWATGFGGFDPLQPVPPEAPTPTPVPTETSTPVPTPTPNPYLSCPDFNGDGQVTTVDVGYYVGKLGQPAAVDPRLDLNGDGVITTVDVGYLVPVLGTQC